MSLTEWVARLHREQGQVDWNNPPRFAVVAIDCVAAGWATIPPDLAARGLVGVWETFVVDLHERTHCCELAPSYWMEPLEVVLDVSDEASDRDRDKLDSEKWEYYPSDEGHYVWCMTLQAGKHGTIIDTWSPKESDPDDQPSIDDAREMWQGNCPLLDTTAKAARVRDPTCLPRHLGAKEKHMKDADDLLQEAIGALQGAYEQHVRDLAKSFFDEVKDKTIVDRDGFETWIHETVDGDGWVIYTRKAQAVLLCSSNSGYGVEEGLVGPDQFKGGVPWSTLAYCAMEQDLLEEILSHQEEHGIDINEDDLGIEDEDEEEEPES